MRPRDIYAMPTRSERPWHDGGGAVRALFERSLGEFDTDAAEAGGHSEFMLERKIDRYVGQDQSLTYEVATFRREPFALLAHVGEDVHAFVTDRPLFEAAQAYAERHLVRPSFDLHDADADLPDLDRPYDHVVLPLRGRLEFVPLWHLSPEGTPVLDHVAFDEAFDAVVRPAFAGPCTGFEAGLDGPLMPRLAAEALLAALAPGVTGTDAFAQPAWPKGTLPLGWVGVLARDAGHTYAIGTESWAGRTHFSWARAIRVTPLGPASLYAEMKR